MTISRPISVTIICWILIVTGVIGLGFYIVADLSMDHEQFLKLLEQQNPFFANIQYILAYLGFFISVSSAIAMLYGKNWGRILYVTWGILSFLIQLTISSFKIMIVPAIIMFAIFVFFLFRPRANQYFKPNV